MIIQYNIVVTIINLMNNSTSHRFNKTQEVELTPMEDDLLYNNYHVLHKSVHILDLFEEEINAYCNMLGINTSSIEVDEFEIVSLTDRVDVFFESTEDNQLSLSPIIKCYVYPKHDALKVPELFGFAYDSNTIVWSWPNDEQYAHYLVEDSNDPDGEVSESKIIAQLPIGATSYTETGLEPNTMYTRRLINYTDEQSSNPSKSVTVTTDVVNTTQSLEQYVVPKNYDFTSDNSMREVVDEPLDAFHSGIGDGNDLMVYKQLGSDFYQKFRPYLEITGRRFQKETNYEQCNFNYKVCLEAQEIIEEQEGEVTFDVNVHPREWLTVENYMYATLPVTVKAKVKATIFLRKELSEESKIEIDLWRPTGYWYQPTKVIPGSSKKTAAVIAIDLSSSMDYASGNNKTTTPDSARRITKCKKAAKALVDAFDNYTDEEGNGFTDIEYIIVGWGTTYYAKKYNTAAEAKAGIDTMVATHSSNTFEGVDVGDYTNFEGGLEAGRNLCSNDREVIGKIFFTDGFCNKNNEGKYANKHDSENHEAVIQGIKDGMAKFDGKIYGIFGQPITNKDPDYREDASAYTQHNQAVVDAFTSGTGYVNHKICSIDDIDEEQLATDLIEGLDIFTASETVNDGPPVWVFDGYEKYTTEEVTGHNIDDVKPVEVEAEYSFEFNNTVTPVKYSKKEKRAIIPESSFIPSFTQKLSEQSIYDIILNAAKQTPEWNNGYNKTVGTTDGKYLIKGLFVQDNYTLADEDEISEGNWENASPENGMEGSVNVYTDMDKAGTTDIYGDDCYLVSSNNYLYIDGYTDAIIYDGIQLVTTELNSYDRPMEILFTKNGDYRHLLTNRKNENVLYNGNNTGVTSVLELIEVGDDIWLEGYNGLIKQGDTVIVENMQEDLIAHNDACYTSPVLNYRFNIEDPDAKTPLYEILPDCNPDSNYLNVVILHIYYAKNVWVTNKDNHVAQFGDSPLATPLSPYFTLIENLYKWTQKEWETGTGTDNGWYIDDYLWFMAKPMKKTQDYYDELPGENMNSFYGMVNSRYGKEDVNGKSDLVVDTPQFNIPTTVIKDSIKIYIMITEFHPETSLVQYKWEHPYDSNNSITQVNGDYVTFSSDGITTKNVEYLDIVSTIDMSTKEVFGNKPVEMMFEIDKPESAYEYDEYYLYIHTDNSDVIALRYPTNIVFDQDNKALIGATFKGVVNSTSQWAPRIHNGYYYLNQHEYFAYSEFDVEANFDTELVKDFKTKTGYISIDVMLRRKAPAEITYVIDKNSRAELIQNEENFQWVTNHGLTLKPYIDGEYYKRYLTYTYYSPVMMFENTLTEPGLLTVDYHFEDGTTYLPMEIRAFDVNNNQWSDWIQFTNNTAPTIKSSAYQLRMNLQASVQDNEIELVDYACCYLDWKDDMDEIYTINIVTITDYMMAGPDKSDGIYISRVLDFGCETTLSLDIFDSKYNDDVQLYIATSNRKENLLLESIRWTNVTPANTNKFTGRYFRYKLIIPYGEKLYWLRKQIKTIETHALLPYITSIKMTGKYKATDEVARFTNTEAFEIKKDGNYHTIINRLSDIISADITKKGFKDSEVEFVDLQCTTPDVVLKYNQGLNTQYPYNYLNTSVSVMSNKDYEVAVKNTPYIFTEKNKAGEDVIVIKGTPQQYCPITVEDIDGNPYTQLFTDSFLQTETFVITKETKFVELSTNQYDSSRFVTCIDGNAINDKSVNFEIVIDNIRLMQDEYDIHIDNITPNTIDTISAEYDTGPLEFNDYRVVNHLVIFSEPVQPGHIVKVHYMIPRTFIADIDRDNNTTTIRLFAGSGVKSPEKCKVFFETSKRNNKFIADKLSLNPIYRTDYKGFIYLTDEHNEPFDVNIYCNPLRLKAGGFDKVDISVEVLDTLGNPVISKDVAIDCEYGILNCDNYITDMNGVVHLIYESSYTKCVDKITVKVLKDDNSIIEKSISIINE